MYSKNLSMICHGTGIIYAYRSTTPMCANVPYVDGLGMVTVLGTFLGMVMGDCPPKALGKTD